MIDQKIKATLDQADQQLHTAQKELFKSEEDVVPYMACSSARQSITNYLTGFLLKNGVEMESLMTIDDLLNKCREIDPKFIGLQLGSMPCKNEAHDVHFCTDLKKVEECIQLAERTKKIINQETWPLSKRVK